MFWSLISYLILKWSRQLTACFKPLGKGEVDFIKHPESIDGHKNGKLHNIVIGMS